MGWMNEDEDPDVPQYDPAEHLREAYGDMVDDIGFNHDC